MTYQVIGAAAKDPAFQDRCRGGAIELGRDIIAAPLASMSISSDAGADLTTTDCKNLAMNFCKRTNLFTDEALASLVLLNSTVAANPMGSLDSAVQYQLKQIWLTLVEIG